MDFKEKSAEDLATMSASELSGYFMEKNAADRKNLDTLIAGKASKEDIQEVKDIISANIEKQYEQLNGVLKAQGVMIAKLSKTEKPSAKSLRGELKSNIEDLKSIKGGSSKKLSIKAVGTMLESTNITGDVPQAQRLAGLNIIPVRQTVIADLINRAVASSNVVDWVNQVSKEGAAGGTAEGALKNQIDFDIIVESESLKKRTAFTKVSEEMLEDVDFIDAEIRNNLVRELNLDIENQLLNGDGVGANLNGILTKATPFAAGTFASQVQDANVWDVLKVALNQIAIAHFMGSVIVMNNSDITAMNLTKGTDGHYVMPPFTSAEGLTISGVRIVPSLAIAAGDYLVMDGSRATAYWNTENRIEVGRENDDFTKNLVTILIESRLLLVIKDNDTGAFVKGTFATDVAAIDKP